MFAGSTLPLFNEAKTDICCKINSIKLSPPPTPRHPPFCHHFVFQHLLIMLDLQQVKKADVQSVQVFSSMLDLLSTNTPITMRRAPANHCKQQPPIQKCYLHITNNFKNNCVHIIFTPVLFLKYRRGNCTKPHLTILPPSHIKVNLTSTLF